MAPELFRCQDLAEAYSIKVDVYSFGIVLWELITGREAWSDTQNKKIIEEKVLSGERPKIPAECPVEFGNLIEICWHDDPDQRWSFDIITNYLSALHDIINDITASSAMRRRTTTSYNPVSNHIPRLSTNLMSQFGRNISNPKYLPRGEDSDVTLEHCLKKTDVKVLKNKTGKKKREEALDDIDHTLSPIITEKFTEGSNPTSPSSSPPSVTNAPIVNPANNINNSLSVSLQPKIATSPRGNTASQFPRSVSNPNYNSSNTNANANNNNTKNNRKVDLPPISTATSPTAHSTLTPLITNATVSTSGNGNSTITTNITHKSLTQNDKSLGQPKVSSTKLPPSPNHSPPFGSSTSSTATTITSGSTPLSSTPKSVKKN